MQGEPVIPPPLADDDDDVAWALQTAAVQWQRGSRADAVVWLRRAVDAAIAAGNPARTKDLTELAAHVADRLVSEALSAPDSAAPPAPPSEPVRIEANDVDDLLTGRPPTGSQWPAPKVSMPSLTSEIPFDFEEEDEFDDQAPTIPPVSIDSGEVYDVDADELFDSLPTSLRPPGARAALIAPPPSSNEGDEHAQFNDEKTGDASDDAIESVENGAPRESHDAGFDEPTAPWDEDAENAAKAAAPAAFGARAPQSSSFGFDSHESTEIGVLGFDPLPSPASGSSYGEEPAPPMPTEPPLDPAEFDAPPPVRIAAPTLTSMEHDDSSEPDTDVAAVSAASEIAPEPADFAPGSVSPEAAAIAPEPPARPPLVDGILLSNVRGFEDLPDDVQSRLAESAVLTTLGAEEEVGSFGAALVTRGRVGIMPSIADVSAAFAQPGDVVFTRGSLGEGILLRVVALEAGTVVASWNADLLRETMVDCPWVADELRLVADRFQALAGATLGALGDRLDDSLRGMVMSRLEAKAYEPGETIVVKGKPVPGLYVVGAGRVELVEGDTASDEVGPGEFLFAQEVLSAGSAGVTARAGKSGAVTLFATRAVAHELLLSVPPLIEILAG
jgi:hypothetical protein